MGVKGLWKIIGSCGEQEIPTDLTLAIDTSIWVHQYKGMSEVDAVYFVSKKILKLLYHNINPVFIFDGPPNVLKKKVIDERKKEKNSGLIKDIINNVQCKKCKIKLRICVHGGLLKDNFKEGDIVANSDWGDLVANAEWTKSTNEINRSKVGIKTEISEITDFIQSESHTNAQKLKMLVKMRERRKNRLEMNDSSMDDFSKSQLKNIKNRNLVSFYIKKLEQEGSKKVVSDCKKSFTFQKQNVASDRNLEEENSSSDLNDFLEINDDQNENKEFSKDYNYLIKDISNVKDKSLIDLNYDKVVTCGTKSENYNDGFFGELMDEDTNTEENRIDYDFSKGRQVRINSNGDFKTETLDFLSIQSIIKDIIKVFNLPSLDSPSESDAQCAFLYKAGLVDGVITEDNDILLHGGVVYKNFFRKNKSIMKFDPKKIELKLGLTTLDLIHLGYVLGSDYTVGLKGIGIKKAVEYIHSEEYKEIQTDSYLNVYLKCPVREDWKPKFQTIEVDKLIKYWITNRLDKERIEELEFLLKNKKQKM